jgi:CBS domain containing-hemolysin-like protein
MKHSLLVILVVIMAGLTYMFMQAGLSADETGTVSGTRGRLEVVINDEVGVPIKKATVKITSQDTNKVTTISEKDTTGMYIASLAPGTYTVEAQSVNYQDDTQPVTLEAGQTQQLTFYLSK